MKVLLAGGSGFIGRHLIASLNADSHQVWVLSRNPNKKVKDAEVIAWDGKTLDGWQQLIGQMDTVVNLCGLSTSSWPWTKRKKQRFQDSRVNPGLALASAIKNAPHRPDVFIQISGINHYGLRGKDIAEESSLPGEDYLAQLTIVWENATRSVEEVGVRHVVCRTAVVLANDAILVKLLTLPVRLFFGGRLGTGKQAFPWIHIKDQIGAIRFLMQYPDAKGAYNLIAPQATSNAEFMRVVAMVLRRPYWFHVPGFLLHLVLGEMSVLITEGRLVLPKRLIEQGYTFQFPQLRSALEDILIKDSF